MKLKIINLKIVQISHFLKSLLRIIFKESIIHWDLEMRDFLLRL